jgi:hypothetical protein
MRLRPSICFTLALVCAGFVIAAPVRGGEEPTPEGTVVAAEEAATDPTRGQWDSFLDPLRDAEDALTDAQKTIEDKSKLHIGFGILKSWQYVDNDPESGIITLHSLDPDHDSVNLDLAQLSLLRPSEGFIPGFGLKLDAGRIAKRIKPDWNGNGVVGVGDDFEKSDFEVQDAYLTWTVPKEIAPLEGITFKGGKFVTLLGAEVIEPWLNFNFSRSFLFGYAIPFTHTGGLITVPISESVSATGGLVVGWDNVENNNDVPSEIGNVTWVVNDWLTLSANGIIGPEQKDNDESLRAVGDLIATVKPTDKLTFLLNYDYGHEDDATATGGAGRWQGFAAVTNYQWTDRFNTAWRIEWFNDGDGVRTGTEQTLWESTLSAKYLVTQHFMGMLEYRHDGSNHDVFEGATGSFSHGNQDIVGFNFTYLWN